MADIFVSYSHADRERAEAIVAGLEASGFSVFIDRHLVPGSRFSESLAGELAAAKAVVVCWSAASVTSHWVADEAGVARDSGRLIPVSVDGSEPPLGFKQFHTIDLSGWRGERDAPPFSTLASAAGALISGAPFAPPAHQRPNSVRRSLWMIAGIAAAAASAMVAFLFLRPDLAEKSGRGGRGEVAATDIAALGASIAVIPFANVSPDAEHEAFVDGLSDELLVRIATISGVRVPGRSSCFYFKGRPAPVGEIAETLGVRYVLEGSVRRSGEVLRIAAQLTDAASGYQVWSQTYDRTLADIFEVQRDIADEVLKKLPGLLGAQRAAEWEQDVVPRAHEFFLVGLGKMRGRYLGAGWREAYDAFLEAARLDPDYPLANAYLAVATTVLQPDAAEQASKALAAAVAAAPENADVLFAQGFVAMHAAGEDETALGTALDYFDRALAIDPSHSEAHHARIRLIQSPDEKIAAWRKLIAVDPLFFNARLNFASLLADLGRWDEAEAEFENIYRLNPDFGREGAISLARGAGEVEKLGKFAFADFGSASLPRVERYSVAGLLADFGALAESRWLYAQEDSRNFLFLPRQQEVFLKWLDGDFEGAAEAISFDDYARQNIRSVFGAVATALGRRPDLAISLLESSDPEIGRRSAAEIAAMPALPGQLGVRIYAIALAMKGQEARARPLFDALLGASNSPQKDLDEQQRRIFRATDFAWSGRRREALAEIRAARAAHWRYPRTYVLEFSPWPDIDGPYGLLSPLQGDLEFQRVMAEIRAENAALLQAYEAEYAILKRIRAMMSED